MKWLRQSLVALALTGATVGGGAALAAAQTDSGVQLNVNTTGQYLEDNVITNNMIGTNNLLRSPSARNGSTVGVSTFVAAASDPLTVTVTGNRISSNTYGIDACAGTTLTESGNAFVHVTTPVVTG
jgi:hypothetical protein